MANPFEEARFHVWTGLNGMGNKKKYICHAIKRAASDEVITEEDCDTALQMIQNGLGEHASVIGWLCNEAGIRLGEMDEVRVQSYRFRWLEELASIWNQGERT